jgi:hypothetical protein
MKILLVVKEVMIVLFSPLQTDIIDLLTFILILFNCRWKSMRVILNSLIQNLIVKSKILNLRKIKEFDAKGKEEMNGWYELKVDAGYKIANNRDAMDFLKNGKFGVEKVDGVVAKNIIDAFVQGDPFLSKELISDVYLVFNENENNIKLADGSNTTFDATNNDIRFEQGGEFGINKNPDKINYRIVTEDYRIKYAGTGHDSWFTLDKARKLVDYSKGEMIYEYNYNGDMMWEVFANGGELKKEDLLLCDNCGWTWKVADSTPIDKYICYGCGHNNYKKSN